MCYEAFDGPNRPTLETIDRSMKNHRDWPAGGGRGFPRHLRERRAAWAGSPPLWAGGGGRCCGFFPPSLRAGV